MNLPPKPLDMTREACRLVRAWQAMPENRRIYWLRLVEVEGLHWSRPVDPKFAAFLAQLGIADLL